LVFEGAAAVLKVKADESEVVVEVGIEQLEAVGAIFLFCCS
jgi:hypothetical protein